MDTANWWGFRERRARNSGERSGHGGGQYSGLGFGSLEALLAESSADAVILTRTGGFIRSRAPKCTRSAGTRPPKSRWPTGGKMAYCSGRVTRHSALRRQAEPAASHHPPAQEHGAKRRRSWIFMVTLSLVSRLDQVRCERQIPKSASDSSRQTSGASWCRDTHLPRRLPRSAGRPALPAPSP